MASEAVHSATLDTLTKDGPESSRVASFERGESGDKFMRVILRRDASHANLAALVGWLLGSALAGCTAIGGDGAS
ncbi:MAG: hypothetical protein U0163_05990 [Gemmatimonadaceae bacterium]